jgi:predicted nucleic-acid-binding Zn-ribbon protein
VGGNKCVRVSKEFILTNCQRCGFKRYWKTEKTTVIQGVRVRVWKCRKCGEEKAGDVPFMMTPPKKLYFDVERGYSKWLHWDAKVPSKYLNTDNLIEEGHVLCFAAAWLDEADEFQYIHSFSVTQAESLANDDRRILTELWQMMDEADYIVGHNSDKYDMRLVKGRFDTHGMGFPYKARQVDSLKLAKKHMMKMSYKLDYLTGGGKDEMSNEDWKQIALTGDPAALQKMETYCRKDVRIGAVWFKDVVREIEMSGETVWK